MKSPRKRSLRDALDVILAWHRKRKRPVANLLQPGLSRKEILEKTRNLPFKLPDELVEVYEWRNGTGSHHTAKIAGLCFTPLSMFNPLEHAILIYEQVIAKLAVECPEDFKANWFPMFEDGFGGSHFVECGELPESGSVINAFGDGVAPWKEFNSIHAMTYTYAECFEHNVISLDEDGNLDPDYEAYVKIARKYNPGIEYPYSTA